LAETVHADYCWQTSTEDRGISFSVCEYGTAERAAAGRSFVIEQGKAFGERTVLLNKKTMLNMRVAGENGAAQAKRVEAAFLALK
jgi:hypothetical protein